MIEQLEESARLIGSLLEREPNSDPYLNVAIAVDRRLGDALALMKRSGEAIEHQIKAREAATRLLAGPNGPAARQQLLMVTAKLALLYAEAGDPRGSTLAQLAATELSARPIEAPGVEAVVRADLARVSALGYRWHFGQ